MTSKLICICGSKHFRVKTGDFNEFTHIQCIDCDTFVVDIDERVKPINGAVFERITEGSCF